MQLICKSLWWKSASAFSGYRTKDQASSVFWSLKAACSVLLMGLLSALFSGCTYLPSSGPSPYRIRSGAAAEDITKHYELIPITGGVVRAMRGGEKASITPPSAAPVASRSFRPKFRFSPDVNDFPPAAPQRIAVGDVINVTIFETGGALFGSSGSGSTPGVGVSSSQLPPQMVDDSGAITVPFVGRIKVKGRAPNEVETEIVARLKNKAINPFAIVTVGERKGDDVVTVTGDVKSPGVIPLGFAGGRLLEAVTASGGGSGRACDTRVTLIRGSQVRSNTLDEITNDPSKNVALQQGDTVVLKYEPRTYLVFGVSGKNARYGFKTDQVSLAEAMAEAGGPMDLQSNPSSIYVYRFESKDLVKKLGRTPLLVSNGATPVIYQLDLLEPTGFFLAQQFEVRDKDIIYFSTAGSVGLAKFLKLVSTITVGSLYGEETATAVGAP